MSQVINLKFTGDSSNLKSVINDMQGTLKRLTDGWKSDINAISSALNVFKQVKDTLSTPFKDAMQFEDISVRMAPMLGGLEKTRALLKDIRLQSANGVAGFEDLAKTVQVLSAAFQDHSTIKTWVEAFHNMSAVTGKSTTEMAAKFMEVRATGEGMMEMLKQYAQNGVNIFSVIAKERGITENAVTEGIKNRTIGLEEVERAILSVATGTGELANQASAMSNTFSGTIDTIVAKMRIDFADKIDPMLKPLADGLNLIYDNFKHIAIAAAGVVVAMNWRSAIATAMSLLERFFVMGKAGFLGLSISARAFGAAVKSTLISSGIGLAIVAIGEAFAFVYESITETIEAQKELDAFSLSAIETQQEEVLSLEKILAKERELADERNAKILALERERESKRENLRASEEELDARLKGEKEYLALKERQARIEMRSKYIAAGFSLAEAEEATERYFAKLAQLEARRAQERHQKMLEEKELEISIEEARARGDTQHLRSLTALREHNQLVSQGFSEEEAASFVARSRAAQELAQRPVVQTATRREAHTVFNMANGRYVADPVAANNPEKTFSPSAAYLKPQSLTGTLEKTMLDGNAILKAIEINTRNSNQFKGFILS